ncbi:MAG: hypothetical protein ACI8PZ_002713 [Myxococcota bacterium]|jgi:hypothetical protein
MRWLTLSLVLSAGCSKKVVLPDAPSDLPVEASGVTRRHLMVSPESTALGRFASTDAAPLDETDTRQTVCSAHFSVAEEPLDADPLRGLYSATPGAAAKWDIHDPGASSILVWRNPTAATRRVARITDPGALEACCTANPADCDPWFVGATHVGAGTLAWRTSAQGWLFGDTQETPGQFGFELSANPYATPDCGTWQRSVPRAAKGAYFLGISNATFTEKNARRDATKRASAEASNYLRGKGRSDAVLDGVREERWCIDTFPGAGGTQYLAHVLLFMPVPE